MIEILQKFSWREAVFSVKSFAAAMLALYIAFRLDFSQPMWSVTTVYVVSQPLAGMVLSKSLYRIFGTFIGAGASLVFVALFSDSRELFCLALALWIGLGSAITIYLRDAPQGYVGMLSGYSAAIIGLPAALAPESAFDFAVARCLEISLGILCATLVHHLVFPQRAGDSLRKTIDATLPNMARWAGDALRGQHSETRGLIDRRRVLGAVVSLDTLRVFANFDTPALRVFDPVIRQFEARLLSLLAMLMSVYDRFVILSRERPPLAVELRPLLERAAAHMAESAGARTPAEAENESTAESVLRADIESRLPSLDDLRGGDPVAFLVRSILLRLIDVIELWRESVWLRAHVASGTRLPGNPAVPALRPYRDLTSAIIGGAVAAVAVIASSAFWILSAWPNGTTAVTFTGVICAIMGGRDNPGKASMSFLWVGLAGCAIAFCYVFVILPPLSGFVPLVLALAPFFLLCGLLLALPQTVPLGLPLIFCGGALMGIANVMDYDAEAFFNNAVALIAGIGMGGMALRLLRPPRADWTVQRLLQGLFRDLAQISRGAPIDRTGFESRMFDRINALFARLDPMIREERETIQGGLASLRFGLNILALRMLRPALTREAVAAVTDVLGALAEHFSEVARDRERPLPDGLLLSASRRILASSEDTSAVRAAEAMFNAGMIMRQHAGFFGEPPADDAPGELAAVSA